MKKKQSRKPASKAPGKKIPVVPGEEGPPTLPAGKTQKRTRKRVWS